MEVKMISLEDEKREIRAQRHDFLKEYYRMAVLDLDRHLKGGWQTIAILAGGVAAIAAGHDGRIGFPMATTIALIAAFWGALSIIDANYWSLRAIAFLANVEAVYLTVDDRKNIHAYVGSHPPFKLTDSLRYLFSLCLAFGTLSLLNLFWTVNFHFPTLSDFLARVQSMRPMRLLLWDVPILAALLGSLWVVWAYRKRLYDYRDFSETSPGPGLALHASELRYVTFEALAEVPRPQLEANPQLVTQQALREKCALYDRIWYGAKMLVIALAIVNIGILVWKFAF
jgi:hypothetical protein